jgi:hypothetical protein
VAQTAQRLKTLNTSQLTAIPLAEATAVPSSTPKRSARATLPFVVPSSTSTTKTQSSGMETVRRKGRGLLARLEQVRDEGSDSEGDDAMGALSPMNATTSKADTRKCSSRTPEVTWTKGRKRTSSTVAASPLPPHMDSASRPATPTLTLSPPTSDPMASVNSSGALCAILPHHASLGMHQATPSRRFKPAAKAMPKSPTRVAAKRTHQQARRVGHEDTRDLMDLTLLLPPRPVELLPQVDAHVSIKHAVRPPSKRQPSTRRRAARASNDAAD